MGYGQGRASVSEKVAIRTVVLASADSDLRHRLRQHLTAMRWEVREAGGGAEAIAQLETAGAEALLVDSALPDLEVGEFAGQMRSRYPGMDLLRIDGGVEEPGGRSPRRNELLHALRLAQEDRPGKQTEMPAQATAPVAVSQFSVADRIAPQDTRAVATLEVAALLRTRRPASIDQLSPGGTQEQAVVSVKSRALPDMLGESEAMAEMTRLVRLVAPRSTTVLIEGETGTGKDLVAKGIHRLSPRSAKAFVVLNCAAIPESLLEAELFGHTRGAFTGAVQSRTGRIEAADGGTLFLDEIGEMPLALQAKMLRFLESGELQRVGDNATMQVNVRVVAATHQPLQQRVAEKAFRLDLYHRLAVFPVAIPALRERMEDVLPLAEYLLARLGEEMPMKRLSTEASMKLMEHDWPGNVRELAHVLERAAILAEDRMEIAKEEIRF
jgi:DNA-binding NtrC family response regulator